MEEKIKEDALTEKSRSCFVKWTMRACVGLCLGIAVFSQTSNAQTRTKLPSRPPVPNSLEILKPIPKKNPGKPSAAGEESADGRSSAKYSMSGKPMHLSCNRSVRDLKTDRLECFGNVYLRRPSELLTADYAILDLKTEDLHAEGNVVYFTGSTVIYGDKMDFNFTTETGIIHDGRIENDRYELLGEYIERISDDEFNVRDGEYTTCRDCPASWKLAAKSVDFQVDGYAHLGNVYVKVNEAPTLYMPYMIIPVKTKRQSGLLFPKFGTSQLNGFTFVQPLYLALSRSTDATLGAGVYTNKGRKAEGQFRYVLDERSKGELNAFYLRDKTYEVAEKYQNRWALDYRHNLTFPWKIEQKLTWLDASDRDYARLFPQDIPGAGEPALVSDAGISRAGRDVSVWADAKRIHNLLTPERVGFDSTTVQLLPSVSVATADHRISEVVPLHWGLSASYSRFWRPGESFDSINVDGTQGQQGLFIPGTTPLRRGQRYTILPELYYTARAWDVIEIIPSAQYRAFFYNFDTPLAPTLARGYLVGQTEVATTFEKVYDEKVKHKIRPAVTYSNIPVITGNKNHPFVQQLDVPGYQFDENDVVPIKGDDRDYNVPLGNSVSYQIENKFILKSDEAPYVYTKALDVISGQSIDFKNNDHPLSRLFTTVSVSTLRINGNAEYYYYPYVRASTYNLGMNYIFSKYSRRLLDFERSAGLGYNYNQVLSHTHSVSGHVVWSINDYFQVGGALTYSIPMYLAGGVTPEVKPDESAFSRIRNRFTSGNVGLTYQSPSQCYRLMLLGSINSERGWDVSFKLPINLSGSGFTSFTDGGGYNTGT